MLNYNQYLTELKSRHPRLSPLEQLLQIDFISCLSLQSRLLSHTNFDQTQSSLLLYSIFLQYLEIPEGSKTCFSKDLIADPSEISECLKVWEKRLGSSPKPPKESLPVFVWISGYTALCDLEPKGSNRVLWNGILQTDLIRPKLREELRRLVKRSEEKFASEPQELAPF